MLFKRQQLRATVLILIAVVILQFAQASSSLSTKNNHDDNESEFFDDGSDGFWHEGTEGRELQDQRVNIFQKLGESIVQSIIGILLICLMPILIWKNEGRHVRELQRIDFCKNEAVAVNCQNPESGTVGRLVHFTGTMSVGDESLGFGDGLDVTESVRKAMLIKRSCYIYQKFERSSMSVKKDRIGGGETRTTTHEVVEDWTPQGPQPATLPNTGETNTRGFWDQLRVAVGTSSSPQTAKSTLPANIPPEIASQLGLFDASLPPHNFQVSQHARVGEFKLSDSLVVDHPQVFSTDLVAMPNHLIPSSVVGCSSLQKGSDNVLRTFAEGSTPQNGDVKVVYEYAEDGFDCSFVVEQIATTASTDETDEEQPLTSNAKYGMEKAHAIGNCSSDLGEIWMVRRGVHDLDSMIDMAAEDEGKVVKLIRVVAFAVLCAGWVMLFAPFLTALEVLPILGSLGRFAVFLMALIVSLLCCGTFTTLAYIRFRPLLGTLLLLVIGGTWGIVAWRLNIAVEDGGEEEA